jgi:hypothetical protein
MTVSDINLTVNDVRAYFLMLPLKYRKLCYYPMMVVLALSHTASSFVHPHVTPAHPSTPTPAATSPQTPRPSSITPPRLTLASAPFSLLQ